MLMELEPAKEITGGPWYGADAFDVEFIEVLQKVGQQQQQGGREGGREEGREGGREGGVQLTELLQRWGEASSRRVGGWMGWGVGNCWAAMCVWRGSDARSFRGWGSWAAGHCFDMQVWKNLPSLQAGLCCQHAGCLQCAGLGAMSTW